EKQETVASPQSVRLAGGHRFAADFHQALCHLDQVAADQLGAVDGLLQRHGDDLVAAQRHHAAELAFVHHVNGADAVARGQHAVEGAGRAAALDVPQHHGAALESGAALQLPGQHNADAAQPDVAELVAAQVLDDGSAVFHVHVGGKLGAFGHHHDAEVAPARVTAAQALGDLFDVKGALGNQDDVGAAGDPAVHGDPAGVAAHDLHHDDPVVGLGGGVHTVNGFGGDADGGGEAEAEVGAAEIVVNGLGNADYLGSALVQTHGDRLRVVAADGDEGVNFVAAQVLHAALQAAFALGRVGARGAQDGAAARQDAGHRLQVERHGLVFHHPAPAFHEADELVAVVEDAFANDGSYDGVQPGAVAAAGENSDLHNCVLKR